MAGPEDKVADLIAPIMEDMGYDLVRVRLFRGGDRNMQTLQVMAERPDGSMNVEDCALVSKAISALLDVEDPIRSEYTLEVSSPGIDRPLVRLRDFERHKGHIAKIELNRQIDGRRRFRGTIADIDGDENISLATDDGTCVLAFSDIEAAKLILTDELVEAHRARLTTD